MAFLSFGRRQPGAGAVKRAERAGADNGFQRLLLASAHLAMRWRRPILAVAAGVFVVSLAGMSRIQVDSNYANDLRDETPLRIATERIDRVMGGMTNLIYLFEADVDGGIKEPEVLREMERVQRLADSQGGLVRKTYSIVDILKDLNRAFHEDDPAWYVIPESRALVAQYLLLYEMSGGEETEKYVSPDYTRAGLEVRIALGPTSEMQGLDRGIKAALTQAPLEHSRVSTTGIGALWLKLMDYIVSSQVEAFVIAFVVIAGMMVGVFRSWKVGLISMVPNLSPVFLTLGVIGFLGLDLDYSKIAIAGVSMGIAVDDTIHLVTRFRHEFRRCGRYREALLASMKDVGRALVITSVALVVGFLVSTRSELYSNEVQGLLLAGTIVIALIADFLLMPALILTFRPFGPETPSESVDVALAEAA
jgi:predicted RND superfamily exporter protein